MRANATLLFFLYLLGVFVWRHFAKAPKVQRAIHGACLGPALQWYTLLLVGCAVMACLTLYEFFGSYYGLDSLEVKDNLEHFFNRSIGHLPNSIATLDKFNDYVSMPKTLKLFSMLSMLAGIPVLVVAAGHIFVKFAHPGMRIVMGKETEASMTPWWPGPRMSRLITIMLMPVLLSVMSMRGSCRIWALTTGQADSYFHTSFDKVEKWENALYHMDQEVGQLFQFVSVYAFAHMCSSMLNDSLREVTGGNNANNNSELAAVAKEFMRLVRYAGFLGVWAFILVGCLRCLLEFFVEESRYYGVMEGNFSVLNKSVLKPANMVFSFLTIVCVVNMFIVGRARAIKDRLGNANLKFMGARLLLLIIAIQEQILTSDSPLRKQVIAKVKEHGRGMSALELTYLQADLLHLSLLNFECLLVVVFNVFAWRDLELERTGATGHGYSSLCDDEEAPRDAAGAEEAAPRGGLVEKMALAFRPREGAPLLLGTESSGRR